MVMRICQIQQARSTFITAWRSNHAGTFINHRALSIKRSFNLSLLVRPPLRQPYCILRYASGQAKSPVRSEIKRLLFVAKDEKWQLSGAVFLLFVSSAVTMAVPFGVGKLIDVFVSPNNEISYDLVTICQILVVVLTIGAIANFGRVYLMNLSSQRVINKLRKKAFASILRQETAFFDGNKTGELINRLSADTATVGMSITNNISDGLRSLFSFIAGSSLMIYTSPQLASIGLITVTPVAGMALIIGKHLKNNSRNVQDALAGATQVAEERISNIRTVQAFLKVQEENEVYGSKIDSVMHYAKKESLSRAVFFGLAGFSGNLIILSVLYYGGGMMNANVITIGALSSFLLYAAYVGISIGGMGTFYSELMRGLGASTRLWELVDRKAEISIQGGSCLSTLNGDISFNNITFAYPSRPDAPVLSDFSLTIPAGSVYAVVGSSGCGKSTLGSLLLRFYDCQKGTVSIDGHDIKSLNLQWLRKNIGIVSQDPILFSFTIKENVIYGAASGTSVDNELIEDVLLKANALDFVKKLPRGLDTVVGERGVMLSGGQRQRIAIARALLKDPKILILDEATSALDAESEYIVQKALDNLVKSRTVITIAHRLSTVRNADIIIVLEGGKVIEKGKYDELFSTGGSFYQLVQRQNLKPL